MQLAETAIKKIQSLPEAIQREVLDFIEFLEQKSRRDDQQWSGLSLALAQRGLESDNWPEYRAGDLREHWQ